MVEISTSVLNVKREDQTKIFYGLEVAHTDYFHIDVMDGKFVPKDTKEQMKEYINTIKQISNIPIDVHLMVEDVKKFVDEYLSFEPNRITFHLEAASSDEEVMELIKYIKEGRSKSRYCYKTKYRNRKSIQIFTIYTYVFSYDRRTWSWRAKINRKYNL